MIQSGRLRIRTTIHETTIAVAVQQRGSSILLNPFKSPGKRTQAVSASLFCGQGVLAGTLQQLQRSVHRTVVLHEADTQCDVQW